MRYHEIASGIRLPVSSEEKEILDRAEDCLSNSDLDERGQEVARLMASRGLLDRSRDAKGRMIYQASSIANVWKGLDYDE